MNAGDLADGGMFVELSVGQAAPQFTLAATGNRQITLADLRQQPVVLFFYPKDDTPG